MKSSMSHKKITIVTDRKQLLNQRPHSSLTKGSQTCTNQRRMDSSKELQVPMSCKNFTEQAEPYLNASRSVSAQKHKRQRSTSLKGRDESTASQQSRKKQLDNLCFHRMMNIFKKYLIERQQNWDFQHLCYGQLLKLLWLCRFVPYQHEQQFIQNNEQSQLKKVYLLWLSIAYKKVVNFRDFLSFAQLIENITIDQERLEASIFSLRSQLKELCFNQYADFKMDPNYTFFIKKIDLKRNQSQILLLQSQKQRILSEFKYFKLNKLRSSGLFECVKVQQQCQTLVSKKSSQLADQKRKKIEDKIRQKKPHVENINLLDLLSYRQRDHLQTKKTTAPVKKKSTANLKRGQIKRQIELLSRPKAYFQERKEDQIDFQRQQQEYTFHPRINPYKNNGQEKVMQVKNVDKVLIRMKEARKQKEQKQTIIQKGWSNICKGQTSKPFQKNKSSQLTSQTMDKQNINTQKQEIPTKQPQKRQIKSTKYQVSKDYLRIPILYIDVNIEQGKKQRIIIYDNDKAQTLAKEFGQKHKLSAETVGRLEILLQQQMDTVLARIDEETDDECSIIY